MSLLFLFLFKLKFNRVIYFLSPNKITLFKKLSFLKTYICTSFLNDLFFSLQDMIRNVKARKNSNPMLQRVPDDVLGQVVEFATQTLREVLRLQLISKHFRKAMSYSNKLTHLDVTFKDLREVNQLGHMAAGVRKATIHNLERLGSLSGLPAVRSLDFTNGLFKIGLDVMHLTHLRSLNIQQCHSLERIDNLPPGLHDLNAFGCHELVHLPACLPQLLTLNIRNCYNLEAIPLMPQLLTLDATQCPAPLGIMTTLLSLSASHNDHDSVSKHTGLRTLKLQDCAFDQSDFLVPLVQLNTLRLYLTGTYSYYDTQGLSALSNLELLELDGPLTDEHVKSIETLTQLRSLILCCRKMSDEGMRSVAKLQGLTWLELWCSCSPQFSHAGLRHLALPQLQTLRLFGVRDLTDLQGFEGLASLEHLIISSSYRLDDLQHVSLMPKLQTIQFAYCDSLTSLRWLNQLLCLQSLDVSRCWDLHREGLWEIFPCQLSELILNAHARGQLGDEVAEFHQQLMSSKRGAKLIF